MNFKRPNGQHRVVITGVGTISPLGLSTDESWSRAIEGRSGIATITRFDTTNHEVKFAGEVKGYDPAVTGEIDKKDIKKMELFIQYSLSCTKMALAQSGFKIDDSNADRVGVFVGSGMGGLGGIEEQHTRLMEKGPGRVSPFFIPAVITNLAPGWITIMTGARGPNFCITSACATGVHSLGEAYNYVRFGLMDAMIAGGSESTVTPTAIAGFNNMRALSTRNDAPDKASRPWDKDRDGFVLGEGCAVFIVETLESAVNRKAKILCEVSGYGASSDAYHITSPHPEGRGFISAMTAAIKDSGLSADKINYINAHGTSTPMGDPLESNAIKKVFGDHASKVWISSTKSMTGHLLGAAGSVESAFCVKTLETQHVAPTINLDHPSPECDLDYVPKTAREGKIDHVMNNSFGFGGTNSCLIFSRYQN